MLATQPEVANWSLRQLRNILPAYINYCNWCETVGIKPATEEVYEHINSQSAYKTF